MNRQIGGSDGAGSCRNCDRHLSDRFRSVFGDQNDVAHRCLGCDSFRRICRGSAAGADIDLVDPADQPNRNRGARVDAAVRTDGGGFDGD
jgi:hypothetical protein